MATILIHWAPRLLLSTPSRPIPEPLNPPKGHRIDSEVWVELIMTAPTRSGQLHHDVDAT